MPLNLITDAWLPVLREGRADVIRPDQIAEPGVSAPNWPRPDLNLAAYEFLIGLVYLACPPEGIGDWRARRPDPAALRAALAPLAPAFNLTGEGPLFLQDLAPFVSEAKKPELLFLDSASENAQRLNSDLLVKRGRYTKLDLPTAAIALYTLQAFAPGGGPGKRTSMRGGGPMVTLVRPADPGDCPLWSMVWANVPEGQALSEGELHLLPWMRPTETSERQQVKQPPEDDFVPPETFFGMPRRIRLKEAGGKIIEFFQLKHGTNYGAWRHPLSPYCATKEGEEPTARHTKRGRMSYRNWFGVSVTTPPARNSKAFRARCVAEYENRSRGARARVLVAGWAMKPGQATPLDFLWSEQPLFDLKPEAAERAEALVEAANLAAGALVGALRDALGIDGSDGTRLDPEREGFYSATQPAFLIALEALAQGGAVDAAAWLARLRRQALARFDAIAVDGLADLDVVPRESDGFSRRPTAKRIVIARARLIGALSGDRMHDTLGLPRPERKRTGT